MKVLIIMVSLLTQVALAGTALALPVSVNFGNLIESKDITIPNPSVTVNGIEMTYDEFINGTGFAVVDSAGIYGTTGGTLLFNFITAPATSLEMNYSLLDAVTDPQSARISDGLTALFFGGGNYLGHVSTPADFFAYDPMDPTFGWAFGTLSFSGPMFDQVAMLFSPDASLFTIDSVTYEPVPEPATFILLAVGLLGIGVWQYRKRITCG